MQTLITILLVQLFQLSKLRRVTKLGSGVDDENNLALELVKGVFLLRGLLGLEIVKCDHGCDAALDVRGSERSGLDVVEVEEWSEEISAHL